MAKARRKTRKPAKKARRKTAKLKGRKVVKRKAKRAARTKRGLITETMELRRRLEGRNTFED